MIRIVFFDLDDTLYPGSRGMNKDIVGRMNAYVARYLGLSEDAAVEVWRGRPTKYGTTLEWLTLEKGFSDPESYFAAVHPEGEEYCLEGDPELARILDSLPVRKAVLTNSPSEHAHRVLAKLGVAERFEAIYDIRFNGLHGKPWPEAYSRACAASGVGVEEALFIDDMPKYVRGFLDLGGQALLIDEQDRYADEGLPRIRSLAELGAFVAAANSAN